MSYPQFQAASDYLGAIADEDYVKALPSNSYEDRGGAVLDGPEAGYKVTYTQADAEADTAEDGSVIPTLWIMIWFVQMEKWHYLTMYKRVLKYWIMTPDSL